MEQPKINITFADSPDVEIATPKVEENTTEYSTISGGKNPLTKKEVERLLYLRAGYIGGIDLPFEIQLAAYKKAGEMPTGIELDFDKFNEPFTVVSWLEELVPLEITLRSHGVGTGVKHPDALALNMERATVIYARIAVMKAEAEINGNDGDLSAFLPLPTKFNVGRNGHVLLFPEYADSPTAPFRGDCAGGYSVEEVAAFIEKHFPSVVDQFLESLVGE